MPGFESRLSLLREIPRNPLLVRVPGLSFAEKIAIFVYRLFTTDQASDTAGIAESQQIRIW